MSRKISQQDPAISIEFFLSGFFTYRSQLFAPFKPVGVNIVQYHDPIIDGANFECTDLFQWTRRPGFTQFCSAKLPSTEVVNQFYSSRLLTGEVIPWVDTSARLASFSPSTITTIVAKTTTEQGYVTTLGNMTYFSDGTGADYSQYDGTITSTWGLAAPTITPVSTGMGFWQPKASYGFGQSILDPNGNIESLSAVVTANGTIGHPTAFNNIALAGSNLGDWGYNSPMQQYRTADQHAFGWSNYLFLESFNFGIPLTATIVGIQVVVWKAVVGDVGNDKSVKLVVGGSVVGTEHASGVPWVGNTLSPTTYGGPGDTWGLALTPAQVNANGGSGFGVVISGELPAGPGGNEYLAVGAGMGTAVTVTVFYTPAVVPSAPGLSGLTEPNWALNVGVPTPDGGIIWTNYGPIYTWYPLSYYPTPVVILDPNGNLQLGSAINNVVPSWNSATTYTEIGFVVSFAGSYWANLLASNTDIPPSPNYAVTSGTGTPAWVQTLNPIVTGNVAPIWNTTVGGTTSDNDYVWENIGQGTGLAFTGYAYTYAFRTIYGHLTTGSEFSNNTGAILGPVNGSITSFSISAHIVTFVGTNNFIVGNIFTVEGLVTPVGLMLDNQSYTVISAVPSEMFSLVSFANPAPTIQITSDVVTVTAANNLTAGALITFTGITDATLAPLLNLPAGPFTVLLSGLSDTTFKFNLTASNYGPVTVSGTVFVQGSWTAMTPLPDASSTIDAGTALPLISTITGTGTGSPLCNSVANITAIAVSANIVTVTARNNFQPGIWVTFAGLTSTAGTFLNGEQFQVIAVNQPVGTQNTYFQVYLNQPDQSSTRDPGTATFNAVEIYRTSDGGGLYLFDGAVTNPGAGLPWTFNDFVPDDQLNILLTAALSHQNDPPPGAPGSLIQKAGTISVYWNGRIWLVSGNYVYFDAGPDCTNGIPESSWPPGNRFQFAGPVLNLVIAPDGAGLLVYLADRVNAILGGPETISFYPTDALSNFGISNPNAVYRDGSIIGQFTTQKQYLELVGGNKDDIGKNIGDYLSENFAADSTYATMHRDGLDVGMFLSNGVDRILRYGSNIGAWSVPAFPSFGAGALRSIETSVGINTLMLATPNGGAENYLYARDLQSAGDGGAYGANAGTPYPVCNITIGSITLSQPGARLFPLQHVVIYADAVGTLNNGAPSQPDVWILPNEVNGSGINATRFVQLPEVLNEPPIGAKPSQTLLALRYPVNMMNSALASQFIHHLQIKVQFEPELAFNTLKAISLMESQDT